ncbi:MAG: molybdenum cofactor biosynthesis protein MoaE [Verrucomicrobiales bacterium]|nr:molybdenum cofactor biosynthesis protein MoaE [Verrucomicrobiales bacterium]
MKTELTISPQRINEIALSEHQAISEKTGAVVTFSGIVRGQEGESQISAINYESFDKMVEHQFKLIFSEISKHWPIESIRLVHRIGTIKVNEVSLWVEIIASHRKEAFAACQYLINEMKNRVPIWKTPIKR